MFVYFVISSQCLCHFKHFAEVEMAFYHSALLDDATVVVKLGQNLGI